MYRRVVFRGLQQFTKNKNIFPIQRRFISDTSEYTKSTVPERKNILDYSKKYEEIIEPEEIPNEKPKNPTQMIQINLSPNFKKFMFHFVGVPLIYIGCIVGLSTYIGFTWYMNIEMSAYAANQFNLDRNDRDFLFFLLEMCAIGAPVSVILSLL